MLYLGVATHSILPSVGEEAVRVAVYKGFWAATAQDGKIPRAVSLKVL